MENYINKKGTKLNLRPSNKKKKYEEKSSFRNTVWIIALFIILFGTLVFLPYMSKFK